MGYCVRLTEAKFYVPTENTGRVLAKTKRSSFDFKMDKDGNLVGIELKCEKLGSNDFKYMKNIAPFVREGSFIELLYEDGDYCRWVFKNGFVKEVWMKCSWEDE